jgi:hypothetical protein
MPPLAVSNVTVGPEGVPETETLEPGSKLTLPVVVAVGVALKSKTAAAETVICAELELPWSAKAPPETRVAPE